MSDLELGIKELLRRRPGYERAEAYYNGTVPEVLPRRLRGLAADSYRVNFLRTVVDSVLDRLELAAVLPTNADATEAVGRVFEENELLVEANELHRQALVYGDAYALVWPHEGDLLLTPQSPLQFVLLYDQENPRRKRCAVKVWTEAGGLRANVYYADKVQKFRVNSEFLAEGMQWQHVETVPNPFDVLPVFHFRTQRPYGRPEHFDAYGLQDAVTKLIVTHMYVLDYQGAPQRYALAAAGESNEVEDFNESGTDRENMDALRNGPGELWYMRGISSVGQFEPADSAAFMQPLREYVRSIASLTSTPLHYFEPTGNVPSGEALRTAEAPLLKKTEDRQLAFGTTWRDLFRFVLAAEGFEGDVQVKWKQVESMDSLDSWDVMLKKRNAGVPMRQVFLEAGYDAELVEQMLQWFRVEQQELQSYVRTQNGVATTQRKPVVRVGPSEEVDIVPSGTKED